MTQRLVTQTAPADDLAFATVAELAELLMQGRVSPLELTRLALDRLARLGPRYNAVAGLTAERALAEARRSEGERQRQRRRGRALGPLHGVPYGAKDLLAARG
ncbi:MAG: amidase family protein, partial [Chloroflexota bacterium]|nr:amidase family protein [Chloroflexota bacterium]